MNTTNDGGPAFPTNYGHFANGATPGMTLLDWYAGQALAGESVGYGGAWEKGYFCKLAERCYDMAEAMTNERAKRYEK